MQFRRISVKAFGLMLRGFKGQGFCGFMFFGYLDFRV